MKEDRGAPLRRGLPADGWDRATIALLVLAASVGVAVFRDYGATWDERLQRSIGRAVLSWLGSGGSDPSALQGGENGNLHLYGGFFEAAAELAARNLPFDPVDSRHLATGVVALIGVIGTALLSRRLGGPRAGFAAALLLLTTPAWWGHAFGNSKDVPFAAPYPWILLTLMKMADGSPPASRRTTVHAGVALGAGLAARPGGLVVLLPLALVALGVRAAPSLIRLPRADRSTVVRSLTASIVAVVVTAWLIMVAAWPYGLLHPLSGPFEAVAAAREFRWTAFVRFAGEWVRATELPRSYAPVWFLKTLPEGWFVAAAAGAALFAQAVWRDRRVLRRASTSTLDHLLVAAAGLGPVVAVVLVRPVLYDGVRHLLFVLPPLAALAGSALSSAISTFPPLLSRPMLATAAAGTALAIADMAALHPYQYVYFNRTIGGGLASGASDFELDYWGATGREAMRWLVEHQGPPGREPLRVKTTADAFVAAHWIEGSPDARSRYTFAPSPRPDLMIALPRWYEHRTPGKVLHVVRRMGVPLAYVLDVRPDGGETVLEGGDFALTLDVPPGWSGRAAFVPDRDFARYAFTADGPPRSELTLALLTPGSGPVPAEGDLELMALERAQALAPSSSRALVFERIVRPTVLGGFTVAPAESAEGFATVAVSALRVGPAALLAELRTTGSEEETARELRSLLAGVRPATPENRRLP
jgi:hypothetical protein